jgi:adenylate cyclase
MLLRPVDRLRVRGRTRPELAFELMGTRAEADSVLLDRASRHAEAWSSYVDGRWAEATRSFEACLEAAPADIPAKLLADRCRHLADSPPSAEWDGVWPPQPATLEPA